MDWLPNVWIRPLEDEPVHGLALRLAEINGLQRMRDLEFLAGFSVAGIRHGEGLDRLAAMIRCDPAELQDRCYRATSRQMRTFRGIVLGVINDIDATGRRCCPGCLAESRHHRFWWDISPIASCSRHSRRLVRSCSCGRTLSWKDASPIKCHGCEDGSVLGTEAEAVHDDVLALDRLLLAKLGIGSAPPTPVLGALDLRAAVEVAGRVGALDALGYRTKWAEPGDCGDPPEVVRARGWRILAEERLGEILDRVYDEFLVRDDVRASRSGEARIDNSFGWFSHWFRYRGGERFSPELARILVERAEGKFRLTSRSFPATPRAGDTVNLSEAAAICGARQGTVRRLLAKEGLVRPNPIKGSPIRIKRADAERIAADLSEALTQADLVPLTGLRNGTIDKLCRADILPVWLKGGGVEAHRFLFRRRDVLAWMEGLLADVRVADDVPADAPLLRDLPLSNRMPVKEMVAVLRRGGMRLARRRDAPADFGGTQVLEVVADASPPPEVVSQTSVVRVLGLPAKVVTLLGTSGLLAHDPAAGSRPSRGRYYLRSSVDALAASILEAAVPVADAAEVAERGAIRLSKAVLRYSADGTLWPDVLVAVAERRLGVSIDVAPGKSLVGSLLVEDVAELSEVLGVQPAMPEPSNRRLSLSEAASALGTTSVIVSSCRKAGLLGSNGSQLGMTTKDLDRFRSRFALANEIVARGGMGYPNLTRTLEAASINPALRLPGFKGLPGPALYARAKVEVFLGIRSGLLKAVAADQDDGVEPHRPDVGGCE